MFYLDRALRLIGPKFANKKGMSKVEDAVVLAGDLGPGDLAFVDPPYSAVHYSRFYHVLETISRGTCSEVSGVGRYPPPEERPKSAFSQKTKSSPALTSLLTKLAEKKVTVILTFPAGKCSNGLSGTLVTKIAAESFLIENALVKSKFSTLGGNGTNRRARTLTKELILLLRPK